MSLGTTRGAVAARHFHSLATELVAASGRDSTYAVIARILRVRPQHYHAAVTGARGVSVERVAAWLERWEAAGWPPLKLVLTSTDTRVEVLAGADLGEIST